MMVSLILAGATISAAVFLYRLHAHSAENLTEDIDSRQVASEIETTVRNLITLLQKGGSDDIEPLHERIEELTEEARKLANTPREQRLEEDMEKHLEQYQTLWQARLHDDPRVAEGKRKTAINYLEKEVLPSVIHLRNHNNREIEKSEEALQRTIKWVAWGLAVVGAIGSLAGILMGYGVARTLRQSMYRLSVRIRDATDKLRHELPTVTLQENEGMEYLHAQMHNLMREIEQTVQRLQQREHEVLRAEQLAAVGQLAAGVAHELRNPLTAVKMLVQSSREDLEERGLPAEDLQVIEQEIRRLERSLQTFLDFARPPKMERREVSLVALVTQALALLGGRARQQRVRIDFFPPDPDITLSADGEQLRQLLVNLMMNALDAMPTGGILTVAVDQDADQVQLSVRDTGAGIAPQIMPRLFEPFVSGKETGLGLGLVVSQRIAEDHGGKLRAWNLPALGACFALTLPRTREEDPLPESSLTPHRQTMALGV